MARFAQPFFNSPKLVSPIDVFLFQTKNDWAQVLGNQCISDSQSMLVKYTSLKSYNHNREGVKQMLYINHLIICEVIPMLSAIKILLVCFLNNETVSAYMKVKGVILQLTLVN